MEYFLYNITTKIWVHMYPIFCLIGEPIWMKLCTNIITHTAIINISILKNINYHSRFLWFLNILCSFHHQTCSSNVTFSIAFVLGVMFNIHRPYVTQWSPKAWEKPPRQVSLCFLCGYTTFFLTRLLLNQKQK